MRGQIITLPLLISLFKPGALATGRHAWLLKIDPVRIIGMRMCVCPRLMLLITSGVMWHDMKPI